VYSQDMKLLKDYYENEKLEYLKGYNILNNENKSKEKQLTQIKNDIIIKDRQIQYKKRKEREKERDLSNGRVPNNRQAVSRSFERLRNGNNNNYNNNSNINNFNLHISSAAQVQSRVDHGQGQANLNLEKKTNIISNPKLIIDRINKEIEELENKVGSYENRNSPKRNSPKRNINKRENNNISQNNYNNLSQINNKSHCYEDDMCVTQIGEDIFKLERSLAELKVNHKNTLARINVSYILY